MAYRTYGGRYRSRSSYGRPRGGYRSYGGYRRRPYGRRSGGYRSGYSRPTRRYTRRYVVGGRRW